MSKTKEKLLLTFILVVVIIFGYSIYRYNQANSELKAALPYLMKGETIDYFNLIGINGNKIDNSFLHGNTPSLIFIFSRPCSPCNKSIVYWKKLAKMLQKENVLIYGIVLGDVDNAPDFAKNARLNFKIYHPQDMQQFVKAWRLKMNYAQTVLCWNNKVVELKIGDLDGESVVELIVKSRKLIKHYEEGKVRL
jgi:peroxiredoxin